MTRSAVLVLLVLAGGACRAADAEVDASTEAPADAAPDVGFEFPGDGGFLDVAPGPKGRPDAMAPPTVACAVDAEAGPCVIPPSFCLDDRWLEYFETTGCVDGGCAYDAKLLSCSGYCADGGCVSRQITAPTPQ